MKVVHIIEALGGGVYTYFKDLSFFFGENEVAKTLSTTIIYSGNRKEIDPEKIEAEFSIGISPVKINMVREISPIQDFKSIILLRTELKKINPDVIHLHSSKAGVLGRIACFLLFKRKKIFYTPHGYAFLRTDISPSTQKIYRFIEKSFQLVFGGATIACGDSEYAIAKELGKSILVRNGIDIGTIRKHQSQPKNQKLTIGTTGRITAQKNPKLFNAIALQFPDYQFIWIGDGEEREQITAPNIKITGWFLAKEQVYEQINSLDIYLQTSLWEGLPIAVLEAMALQKPVLATNIIGNKDIVVPNETGFLFTKTEELEAYFEILKEETSRNNFGKKGLERCQRLFDVNQNFKNLITIYQQ